MRFIARATIFGFRLAPMLLIVYWILIFTGTHLPGSSMKSVDVSDKLMHFGAFAGLSFLLAWSLPRRVAGAVPGVALTALVALAYAVIDEWTQGFVRNRSPSVGDFMADSLGIISGLIIYLTLRVFLYRWADSGDRAAEKKLASHRSAA